MSKEAMEFLKMLKKGPGNTIAGGMGVAFVRILYLSNSFVIKKDVNKSCIPPKGVIKLERKLY
jgi:hypothetical protein